MSSPPPPQPPPQPPHPTSTPFENPPPTTCCYCGSTIGVGVRLPAWNESIVTKEDHVFYFCSKCKVGCNDAWSTAISFSRNPFSIDGVSGYKVRSPIPTVYEDILGVVAFSPYAPEDKQNVFISVDGETRIPLPPTPCLP